MSHLSLADYEATDFVLNQGPYRVHWYLVPKTKKAKDWVMNNPGSLQMDMGRSTCYMWACKALNDGLNVYSLKEGKLRLAE